MAKPVMLPLSPPAGAQIVPGVDLLAPEAMRSPDGLVANVRLHNGVYVTGQRVCFADDTDALALGAKAAGRLPGLSAADVAAKIMTDLHLLVGVELRKDGGGTGPAGRSPLSLGRRAGPLHGVPRLWGRPDR